MTRRYSLPFHSAKLLRLLLISACIWLGLSQASLRAGSAQASITAPATSPTVWPGVAIPFSGTTTTGGNFAWNFGDGQNGAGANTSHAYSAPGDYTVTLTVTWQTQVCARKNLDGDCLSWRTVTYTATDTRLVHVVPQVVINNFSASSTNVRAGTSATLNWSVSGATSLTLSPGGASVLGQTSMVVYPSGTTSYTLTAGNGGGSVSSALSISTYTVSVSISPGSANLKFGESVNLTAVVNPANQGLTWASSGGQLIGSQYTGTASGNFTVTVTSVEDSTKSATCSIAVAPVTVETPVPTPADATTFVNGTVGFTAKVNGAIDTGIIWSVNGGGSISPSGVFTATSQGDFTVTATSHANPNALASVTVHVRAVTVAIQASTGQPPYRVVSGTSKSFSASVTGPGTPSQAVTWSVTPGAGTVDSAGVFTASSAPGDYVLTATSVQDQNCSASVPIRVPGWKLKWKRDVVYMGTKEVAEFDAAGIHVTHTDHLGSPRMTTNSLGKAESAQKYLPFGESLDQVGSPKSAKGFTNHEQTDETGLVYMQARFYTPHYHRFLSPDPARDQHFEETQSWNIYSYVQNMPVLKTDPTGLEALQNRSAGYDGMTNGGFSGDVTLFGDDYAYEYGYGTAGIDDDPVNNPLAALKENKTEALKKRLDPASSRDGNMVPYPWTISAGPVTHTVTYQNLSSDEFSAALSRTGKQGVGFTMIDMNLPMPAAIVQNGDQFSLAWRGADDKLTLSLPTPTITSTAVFNGDRSNSDHLYTVLHEELHVNNANIAAHQLGKLYGSIPATFPTQDAAQSFADGIRKQIGSIYSEFQFRQARTEWFDKVNILSTGW